MASHMVIPPGMDPEKYVKDNIDDYKSVYTRYPQPRHDFKLWVSQVPFMPDQDMIDMLKVRPLYFSRKSLEKVFVDYIEGREIFVYEGDGIMLVSHTKKGTFYPTGGLSLSNVLRKPMYLLTVNGYVSLNDMQLQILYNYDPKSFSEALLPTIVQQPEPQVVIEKGVESFLPKVLTNVIGQKLGRNIYVDSMDYKQIVQMSNGYLAVALHDQPTIILFCDVNGYVEMEYEINDPSFRRMHDTPEGLAILASKKVMLLRVPEMELTEITLSIASITTSQSGSRIKLYSRLGDFFINDIGLVIPSITFVKSLTITDEDLKIHDEYKKWSQLEHSYNRFKLVNQDDVGILYSAHGIWSNMTREGIEKMMKLIMLIKGISSYELLAFYINNINPHYGTRRKQFRLYTFLNRDEIIYNYGGTNCRVNLRSGEIVDISHPKQIWDINAGFNRVADSNNVYNEKLEKIASYGTGNRGIYTNDIIGNVRGGATFRSTRVESESLLTIERNIRALFSTDDGFIVQYRGKLVKYKVLS